MLTPIIAQRHAYDQRSEDHLRYVRVSLMLAICIQLFCQMVYHPRTLEERKLVRDGELGGHTDFGFVDNCALHFL